MCQCPDTVSVHRSSAVANQTPRCSNAKRQMPTRHPSPPPPHPSPYPWACLAVVIVSMRAAASMVATQTRRDAHPPADQQRQQPSHRKLRPGARRTSAMQPSMHTAVSASWTGPAERWRRGMGRRIRRLPGQRSRRWRWIRRTPGRRSCWEDTTMSALAVHWVRHLGLPETSAADKLPYWRCARRKQKCGVSCSGLMQPSLAAVSSCWFLHQR